MIYSVFINSSRDEKKISNPYCFRGQYRTRKNNNKKKTIFIYQVLFPPFCTQNTKNHGKYFIDSKQFFKRTNMYYFHAIFSGDLVPCNRDPPHLLWLKIRSKFLHTMSRQRWLTRTTPFNSLSYSHLSRITHCDCSSTNSLHFVRDSKCHLWSTVNWSWTTISSSTQRIRQIFQWQSETSMLWHSTMILLFSMCLRMRKLSSASILKV